MKDSSYYTIARLVVLFGSGKLAVRIAQLWVFLASIAITLCLIRLIKTWNQFKVELLDTYDWGLDKNTHLVIETSNP